MITLVQGITDILARLNHPNPSFWISDELVQIAITDSNPQFERLYVNRYWRHFLGNLPFDTTLARFHLVEDVNLQEYLSYFESQVAPVIMKSI